MADRHVLNAFAALAARAGSDAGFRARLVADPHAAAREAGVELTPSTRVRFVEKPAALDHLVYLPALDAAPSALTADELEAVAGGLAGECGITCLNAMSDCAKTHNTTQFDETSI